MVKKRPTPEEQLLDFIEKEDKAGAAKFKRKRRFFLSFAKQRDFFFSLTKKIGRGLVRFRGGLREPNIKLLNKIFFIIFCGLIIYTVMDFVFKRPDIEGVYLRNRQMKKEQPTSKIVTELRPFLHYLEVVRRRNIFSPVKLNDIKKPEVKKEELKEMAKDLDLVGISWDKECPVAMIEDKKVKKTYFLKKGGMINNFEIESILKEKVILNFAGEKIELM